MTMALETEMDMDLQQIIDQAWEQRNDIGLHTAGEVRDAVEETLALLDKGEVRVATREGKNWKVHQWVKKAVLLSFRMNDALLFEGGAATRGQQTTWFDKVPSKFQGWDAQAYRLAAFRSVPGAIVRHSAYIAPGVVLMPSFVNVGAYIDEGTMVDTWSTIGSCAQIGKHCHISGGVGIGGVLEPVQADPVIIEDNVFIGARSEIAEGVLVEQGAVISMGVFIGASTKIVDRETGKITQGKVPAYSVVVPGSLPGKKAGDPSLYCAVIVKKVDEKTRSKTAINELLRD